jgi:hypothetical protein
MEQGESNSLATLLQFIKKENKKRNEGMKINPIGNKNKNN